MSQPAPSPRSTLLQTKLCIPQLRRDLLARARLLAKLASGSDVRLTLVVAPAGYGKTSLLCQWVRVAECSVAWLALDPADDDPRCFFRALIAALQTVHPHLGQHAAGIMAAVQDSALAQVSISLINDLAQLDRPLALVLDDYHLITDPAVHGLLELLVNQTLPQLRLLIASRHDPPLPIARLRARRQLVEVRADDLRFTEGEIDALLQTQLGLQLPPDDRTALSQRTEGWIVGLQLAALTLAGRTDISAHIASFSGQHQHILDYLTDEVLLRQPESIQHFLLQTAVLSRLCAPLCDAITGRTDSQALLEQVRRANLFLVALDGEQHWFRYHQLFADALRARHQQSGADIAALHRRASDWHAQAGNIDDAVAHAFAAGSLEQAAAILAQHGDAVLRERFAIPQLRQWLDMLPEALVLERPALAVLAARVRFVARGLYAPDHDLRIEFYLDAAEQGFDPGSPASLRCEVLLLRAELALVRGDADTALALVDRAVARLSTDQLGMRARALQLHGYLYATTGAANRAAPLLRQAASLAHAAHEPTIRLQSLTDLGAVEIAQGQLHAADATYRSVLIEATPHYPVYQACAQIGLSQIAYEWNDRAAASTRAADGAALASALGMTNLLHHRSFLLARMRAAPTSESILDAVELARHTGQAHLRSEQIAVYRTHSALMRRDVASAARWAERCVRPPDDHIPYHQTFAYLVLAKAWVNDHHADQALALARRLADAAVTDGRNDDVIHALLVVSLVYAGRGQLIAASDALDQALTVAAPEGYIRAFVDVGPALREPLAVLGQRGVHTDAIARLLAIDTVPIHDQISTREREVLRLAALGLANHEIADRLIVSSNTIKTHLARAYGKLGARNRVEALAAARAQQLI